MPESQIEPKSREEDFETHGLILRDPERNNFFCLAVNEPLKEVLQAREYRDVSDLETPLQEITYFERKEGETIEALQGRMQVLASYYVEFFMNGGKINYLGN